MNLRCACGAPLSKALDDQEKTEGKVEVVNYKNKELCKVRTITAFVSLGSDKKIWEKEIEKAVLFCSNLSKEFIENGYIVQSLRIVTNAFGEYLNTESYETARPDLQYISQLLEKSKNMDFVFDLPLEKQERNMK